MLKICRSGSGVSLGIDPLHRKFYALVIDFVHSHPQCARIAIFLAAESEAFASAAYKARLATQELFVRVQLVVVPRNCSRRGQP